MFADEIVKKLRHDLLKHLDMPCKNKPLDQTQWRLLLRKLFDPNSGIVALSNILAYKIKKDSLATESNLEISLYLENFSQKLAKTQTHATLAATQCAPAPDAICVLLSELKTKIQEYEQNSSKNEENFTDSDATFDWLLDSFDNNPKTAQQPQNYRANDDNSIIKPINSLNNCENNAGLTEPNKKRVLIVDDRLQGAERIMSWKRLHSQFEWVTLCEHRGKCHTCTHVSNCGQRRARCWRELLDTLESGERVDALLMDLNFDDLATGELLWIPEIPTLNKDTSVKALQGLIMARALRKNTNFAHIPIVLMTSRTSLPRGAELLLDGLDGLQFVDDDVSLEALAARLEAVSSPRARPVTEGNFFWGNSTLMQGIRDKIALLSQGPRTVFLGGPSGSGKSFLVENVILPMSKRKKLITLDLSAVPESLVESELFGHVKGSFSGANRDRIGSAEEADHGILFLDEIGNLSMENQRKLLLFLQDKEVRRIGASQQTRHKVDVKVVVATHMDLKAEVEAGRFRFDLYMRLRPASQIRLPSLCEHSEDMPALIENLVLRLLLADEMRPYTEELRAKCKTTKPFRVVFGHAKIDNQEIVVRFAQQTVEAFMRYQWPGNTREIENVLDTLLLKAFSDLRFMKSPTNILEIDHYYMLSMINPSPSQNPQPIDSTTDDHNSPAEIKNWTPKIEKVEELKELRQNLEKQFYIDCYYKNNENIDLMCEDIFKSPNGYNRHKLIVRMNQLGIKLSALPSQH